MAREISANLDLDSLLPGIAERAMTLLEASGSAVFLPVGDGQTFEAVAAVGEYAEEIRASPVRLGAGIIGSLAAEARAEVVNDPSTDPRTVIIPGTDDDEPVDRMMVAPLVGQAGRRRHDGGLAKRSRARSSRKASSTS